MPLDKKTLEKLKQTLLKEKVTLEKSLEKIAKPVDKKTGDYETTFEDLGSDRDDNAIEVEQYTDNLPVEVIMEKNLQAVLEALKRIEEGTYGFCEKCQQKIGIERLKANPSAKTCIKCG